MHLDDIQVSSFTSSSPMDLQTLSGSNPLTELSLSDVSLLTSAPLSLPLVVNESSRLTKLFDLQGVGIKSKKFDRSQMWAALMDPKAWCLTVAMFGSSVPNGILTNFSGKLSFSRAQSHFTIFTTI